MDSNNENIHSSSKDEFISKLQNTIKEIDEEQKYWNEKLKIERFKEDNDKASKTLKRVSQEWFSGKQKIKWYIAKPEPKKFHIYEPLEVVPFTMLALYIWDMENLNILVLLMILIVSVVIFIFIYKYQQYSIVKIKIDRTKRKGFTHEYRYAKMQFIKYGQNVSLEPFRIPENNKETYKKMSIELQKAITQETGWHFDNEFEYMGNKNFLQSMGLWKSEYDTLEKLLKSNPKNSRHYDDIA